MHHFKEVAEKLREELEKGTFEKLIVGCQESVWPEFEPHLHNYLKQRLLGHFSAEISSITNEQIRDKANRVLQEQLDSRRQELVKEVLGQAQRDGLGATGVRRVLRALEMGEVQQAARKFDLEVVTLEMRRAGDIAHARRPDRSHKRNA